MTFSVDNQCVQTVTTKKVVSGRILGDTMKPLCEVDVAQGNQLYLTINHQIYAKRDIKHLITSLTEIHEAL